MILGYKIGTPLLFAFLLSCSSNQYEQKGYVAKWNSVEVDTSVFKTQYVRYVSTASVYDSPETRKEFAAQLLERKIISNKASEIGLDTLKSVQDQIFRAEEIALARQYVRSKVNPRVKIPDNKAVYDAFIRANTKINLQQIYAPNEEIIRQYYSQLLVSPEKFSILAEKSMIEAGESPDAYKMGWIEWNKMDLEPEEVAFNLGISEISKPVQSLVGWHIFKVIDKEETFFADNSTFQNSKEALAQTLFRRRFEETSVQFIDSVLSSTNLALYPKNASLLWKYLSPRLPTTKNEIPAILIRESEIFNGDQIPPNTTLAVLNNYAFTVGDFMKRLPNIPYWELQPNLRPALETLLKDKLFADKAKSEGFSDHAEVKKEVEITRNSVLNTVFVSTISDTLNLERLSGYWFEKTKNRFINENIRVFETYIFESQGDAKNLLDDYKRDKNWERVLTDYRNSFRVSVDTLSSSQYGEHPVFQINLDPNKDGDLLLWGPYNVNDSWAFIRIISRTNTYLSYEQAKENLFRVMNNERLLITRDLILNQIGYSSKEIEFNEELLEKYYPSISSFLNRFQQRSSPLGTWKQPL